MALASSRSLGSGTAHLTALALQQGEQRALFSGVEDRVLGVLGGSGLRQRTGDPGSSTAAAGLGVARIFAEQPGSSACSRGHASYPLRCTPRDAPGCT